MSASMDPTIKTGQIVLGRMTDIDHVDVGDIVAYRTDSGKTIIHRIISKNQDNTVEFRGDNNPDQISTDKAVAADQIIIKPLSSACATPFATSLNIHFVHTQ